MTIPFPPTGAPDQSVNQDAGAQLSQGMQVLVTSVRGLERVIATQTAMMERTLSASSRYQMGGQRQFRQDVLQEVAGAGASLHGAKTTQVTPLGATSSLQNLQSFAAQRIGQWIAGIPLYEQPGGGPSAPSGGTPVGTPSSQTMGGPVGTPVP